MQQLKVMRRWHSCGSFAQVEAVLDLGYTRGGGKDGFMTEAQDAVKGGDEGFKIAGSAVYVTATAQAERRRRKAYAAGENNNTV